MYWHCALRTLHCVPLPARARREVLAAARLLTLPEDHVGEVVRRVSGCEVKGESLWRDPWLVQVSGRTACTTKRMHACGLHACGMNEGPPHNLHFDPYTAPHGHRAHPAHLTATR